MRFQSLHIQRFGHFADARLEFAGRGLQVIHGHNEAGKSTLLQFVREVLFGFGVQNPYAFLGEKLEGGAVLEFAGQPAVELWRRKGRPDALTLKRGDVPESITESELQVMLGGANGPLFQKVFAFGLAELVEGEESLRIEAVQNALHGSGLSGLANPQRILDQLSKDAESIFKKGGSKQEVATITSDIKALNGRLKDKITKTETYLQRKRDYDTARADAEQLAEKLGQLRKDHTRINKLVTAFPLWREITELTSRRLQLGEASALAVDSRARFDKLLDELKRLSKEGTKLEREIQTADSDLQKNPAQTEWLNLRAQIEQARELIKSVQEARRDLPLLEAELQSNQRQVRDGIEDIIASWSVQQLEDFRCDAGQRSQCEQLAETRRELDNERIRLAEREASLSLEQLENQADLQSVGEVSDITTLQALLNSHVDQVAREGTLKGLLKDDVKQQRACMAQLRKLTPPLPADVTDIAALPIPPAEQIKQFQQRFAESRQRLTLAEQSLADAGQRRDQLEHDLSVARGSLQEIPTSENLRQIRGRRDTGWELIRQRFIDGQPRPADEESWLSSAGESLPGEFERTLQAADAYADRMFDNASLVQKHQQVELARREAEAKRIDLELQQRAGETLLAQWKELWQPAGFVPFDPDTMAAWKAQYDQTLDLLSRQTELKDDIARLQQEIEQFEGRLAAALPDIAGGADARLAAAQERVAHAQQQAQDLKTYNRQAARLQRSAEQLVEDRRTFEARQQSFESQWRAWLAALQFPADWQPDLALTVIGRLQNLRDKLQQIPSLESRLAAMRQRLAEFDPFVTRLCEQVAPDWGTQPTEVAARHLADRLQLAIDTDTRRSALARELQKHRQKLEEVADQQKLLQTERQRLWQLAGVDSDDGFLQEAQRAETIRDIEQQIAVKQRELARLRDFEDEATFLAELQAVDFPALDVARRGLEAELSLLEDDERKANERKGATGRELEQLDGSSAAAEIQGTIVQRRAALANAVDRFVPLLFARHILQQTLQKFEKESQPEMLNDVSQLFAAMTDGRYSRVERPRDAGRPLIVYRANSSDDLEPHQLSTGTREQLYLAIRLAYVLHYCTRTEPLPIVLDDVFANFDPNRTRNTLAALGQITDRVQVLLFTCHPHVAALAQDVFPSLQPIAVPGTNSAKIKMG